MTRLRHGKAKTRVYQIWRGIKSRCLNPNVKQYQDYGGRGISVCERWMIFDNFYADMGEPPAEMSIERINNDDGYHPGNCKWATRTEQGRNQRRNRIIAVDGVSMTMTEWGERVGLKPATIWLRIEKGWSERDAVLTPKLKQLPGMPRKTRLRDHAFAAEKGIPLTDEIQPARAA